jgi:hypothetical protein
MDHGVQTNRMNDTDDTDDDDEIIIIENPKKMPPVIVLCDSDDEDEEKEVISLDDTVASPALIDILSGPEDMDISDGSSSNSAKDDPIWSSGTCSSGWQTKSSNVDPLPDYLSLEVPKFCDSNATSESVKNNKIYKDRRLKKDWYEKFKTKGSESSSLKSSYTCPEVIFYVLSF